MNHSEKDWTRPVRALFNVTDDERKACLASTKIIDSTLRCLKTQIPRGMEVTTAGARRTKMNYIRSAQWRLMMREAFCVAVQRRRAGARTGGPTESERAATPVQDRVGNVDTGFEATGGAAELRREAAETARLKHSAAALVDAPTAPVEDSNNCVGSERDDTEVYDEEQAAGADAEAATIVSEAEAPPSAETSSCSTTPVTGSRQTSFPMKSLQTLELPQSAKQIRFLNINEK